MPLRPVGRRVPAGRAGRAAAHALILRGPFPPRLGTGYYRITNNTNGLSIDSNGNSTAGAAPLETTWTGATTQQWAVNSLGNGVYQIVNRSTGLCLDGGAATTGSPVKVWAVGGSSNLQWTITNA